MRFQSVEFRRMGGCLVLTSDAVCFEYNSDASRASILPMERWPYCELGRVSGNPKKPDSPLLRVKQVQQQSSLFFLFPNRELMETAKEIIRFHVQQAHAQQPQAVNQPPVPPPSQEEPGSSLFWADEENMISDRQDEEVVFDHHHEKPDDDYHVGDQTKDESNGTHTLPVDESLKTLEDEEEEEVVSYSSYEVDMTEFDAEGEETSPPTPHRTQSMGQNSIDSQQSNSSNGSTTAPLSTAPLLVGSQKPRMSEGNTGSVASASSTETATEELEEKNLTEDTYSFMVAAPLMSPPFVLSVCVTTLQFATFVLLALSLIDFGADSNPVNIPVGVSTPVRVTQIVAMLLAMIFTPGDIHTAIAMGRDGFSTELQNAFPNATLWKLILSIFLRIILGLVGMVLMFVLIVSAETVIDLLLNFTALEFVTLVDEGFFVFSKEGFIGKRCQALAESIDDTTYKAPPQKCSRLLKSIIIALFLGGYFAGWAVILNRQRNASYSCSTIMVQFGDDMIPALGTFAGLYDKRVSTSGILESKRVDYVQRGFEENGARFAYCADIGAWTFAWPDSHHGKRIEESNPHNIFNHNNKGNGRRLEDSAEAAGSCNWKARSAETETFDLPTTMEGPWYVKDENDWEILLEPVFISCYQCEDSPEDCSGRGSCSNAVCTCDPGWTGSRCQFPEPCKTLSMDQRFSPFPGFREWSRHYKPMEDEVGLVTAYDRPVFVGDDGDSGINSEVLLFTGRRWVGAFVESFSDFAVPMAMAGNKAATLSSLASYFRGSFHGHWSNYSVEFVSAAMDIGKPGDAASPVGLQWFFADQKEGSDALEIQAPNSALPVDARLLCSICNNSSNPCRYNGFCNANGKCQCDLGSNGTLCEDPPVGDGHCSQFFNSPEFNMDQGDCCETTCLSSLDFTCGFDGSQSAFIGYPWCQLEREQWYASGDMIVGSPFSESGTTVAQSSNGKILAIGAPGSSRVRIFDQDGSKWVERPAFVQLESYLLIDRIAMSSGSNTLMNSPTLLGPVTITIKAYDNSVEHAVSLVGLVFYCDIRSCEQMLDDWHEAFTWELGKKRLGFDDLLPRFGGDIAISSDGSRIAIAEFDPPQVNVYARFFNTWQWFDMIPLLEATQEFVADTFVADEGMDGFANECGGPSVNSIALSNDGFTIAVEFESAPQGCVVSGYPIEATMHLFSFVYNPESYDYDKVYHVLERKIAVPANFNEVGTRKVTRPRFAMSADGSTIVADTGNCVHGLFIWNNFSEAWDKAGDSLELCEPSLLVPAYYNNIDAGFFYDVPQSLSISNDGSLVVVSLDKGDTTAFKWDGVKLERVGNTLRSGDTVATALSGDGTVLVTGLPASQKNFAGGTTVYSRIPTHHANTSTLLLQVTSYDEGTRWMLESNKSSTLVLQQTKKLWELGSTIDKTTIDDDDCLIFSVTPSVMACYYHYWTGCSPPPGLSNPRFDMFFDAYHKTGGSLVKYANQSWEGRCGETYYPPQRTFVGECSLCPEGQQLLQIAVQPCFPLDWNLLNSEGDILQSKRFAVEGGYRHDPSGWRDEPGYEWDSFCIASTSCYTLTLRGAPSTDPPTDAPGSNDDTPLPTSEPTRQPRDPLIFRPSPTSNPTEQPSRVTFNDNDDDEVSPSASPRPSAATSLTPSMLLQRGRGSSNGEKRKQDQRNLEFEEWEEPGRYFVYLGDEIVAWGRNDEDGDSIDIPIGKC